MMFRSQDPTLDEDSSFGLRVWHDNLELITFDSSWTGHQIAQVAKSHTPGQRFYLRVTAAGAALQAKTWPVGDTEPAGWDINASNSTNSAAGYFGWSVQAAAGGANTTALVDDLVVAAS